MKIAVAMSGGLDSSMAALLLKEAGHEIIGITAELSAGIIARHYGTPAAPGAVESARAVADAHGIPLHVVNLEDDFQSLIVEPFCNEYLRGATPNPCVRCNALIKFGRLLDRARSLGCEAIATGHYALIRHSAAGRYYVARGKETAKDQSYFLYRITQESLESIMFPLGGFTKEEVRRMALERRLPVAERPESQEICFIPDNRYDEFIGRAAGRVPEPGDIVDTGGAVIGRHRGIHRYTIGQRRGLAIAAPRPLYVVHIDADRNAIVAGYREDLETTSLFAGAIHFMKETALDGKRALVKTRSTQPPVPALLVEESGGVTVRFDEPQIGISPGQAAVFYNDEIEVLGGGTILQGFKS
ncbi:MAG TPA: tRNA 2-thiouridine(34) synthase MnmA [Spirochaetota bacterium]|nr:tRNA 2-thiouridine(34) synthase MnmA [Spirochaetota bacterium]HPC40809.1 tRNA 2-thiouridine(34) synthase MnmA [Spirochaetota bacterium]HPL15742.1 tRNA 2-thiouridine(34) synthase MnmA [Spirochaetota bacterium]HQF07801.1 tRNA 2-thiouridine(34) synthase MnmA [Spirochaetota bacterium]HQH96854.1 tRNA 2-thiouridine(34) synthase MnmA [Spirochaetota bacterium]